jgi:hypothetical protein
MAAMPDDEPSVGTPDAHGLGVDLRTCRSWRNYGVLGSILFKTNLTELGLGSNNSRIEGSSPFVRSEGSFANRFH